ncbi:TRAP transporter substrate-binding protein [Rhodospirillum sp. A1_3_36]|uniref:TRAP transporter substrate-binding protein n=1 Tax=Rhodospirillum sp. A1_3_36 TaxID=3391666 RepID=UPI0039A6AB2C
MKFNHRAILTAATLMGSVCFSTLAQAGDRWDMALAYAASNYHSEIAAEFAKEVTDKSKGDLEIVTHPGGSLFKGDEIFGAVRRGLVPIGERLISALSNDDPIYEVDSVPFLATSFEDSWKLYQASKGELEKTLDEAGLVLLYSIPWPPQGFYSVKPANGPEDVKGLKFRAYNTTTSQIADMLGMVPAKIETAELSQAFATGVAQSMISSGSTGYDRKLWEYVSYFYDVRAWLPRNMVVVNKEAWDGLSEETKTIILNASATAEKKGWAKAEELANWYLEQFKENGMTVDTVQPAMLAAFQDVGAKLRDEWLEKIGDRGQAILDAYNK